MSLDLCLWFMRCLHIFLASERLGPKLLMIFHTVKKKFREKKSFLCLDERFDIISVFYSYFSVCLYNNNIFININIIVCSLVEFNIFYNNTKWRKFN
jgi:hypothetical protein